MKGARRSTWHFCCRDNESSERLQGFERETTPIRKRDDEQHRSGSESPQRSPQGRHGRRRRRHSITLGGGEREDVDLGRLKCFDTAIGAIFLTRAA